MKIGISTACFYPQPVEEVIDRVGQLGFRTIEIFFNAESEFDPAFLKDLRACMDAHGITLVSVHPYTSLMEGILLFSDYQRRTEDGLRQYRRYFQAARLLGAQSLTFHGERAMPQPFGAEIPERKLEAYRRLCHAAQEEGILLAQENVAWCHSQDPAFLQTLYREIPELRYTLDIKQANRAGHSWKEYLSVMRDRLINVHINDFDEAHSCLLPGEGSMDYQVFFDALAETGFDRQTLIEVYSANYTSEEQILRAANLLRQYAD